MNRHPMDPTAPPPSYDEIVNEKSTSEFTFREPHSFPTTSKTDKARSFKMISASKKSPIKNKCDDIPVIRCPLPIETQTQTQHTTNSAEIRASELAAKSKPAMCAYCSKVVSSKVVREPGVVTHVYAIILCLFGCFCCSCIPYLIDDLKELKHYCPYCNTRLRVFKSETRCPQTHERRTH